MGFYSQTWSTRLDSWLWNSRNSLPRTLPKGDASSFIISIRPFQKANTGPPRPLCQSCHLMLLPHLKFLARNSPSWSPPSLYTVKYFRLLWLYLDHLSCITFVCVTRKVQECLQFEQCVAEKLSSFTKLVSPFRKHINQNFWWRLLFLWFYTSAWGEFLGCMPGM